MRWWFRSLRLLHQVVGILFHYGGKVTRPLPRSKWYGLCLAPVPSRIRVFQGAQLRRRRQWRRTEHDGLLEHLHVRLFDVEVVDIHVVFEDAGFCVGLCPFLLVLRRRSKVQRVCGAGRLERVWLLRLLPDSG